MIHLRVLIVLFVAGCTAVPPQAVSPVDAGRDSGADAGEDERDTRTADDAEGTEDTGSEMEDARPEPDTRPEPDVAVDMGGDASVEPDATNPRQRIPITVPAGAVTESLTDFPLLLDFTHDGLADVNPETGDISFTDEDGNPLPHDIESHGRDDGSLTAWVLLPTLAADVDTTFFLDFEARPNDPTDVWKDYAAVWHLHDVNGSNDYGDRSGNGNDGTPFGGPMTTDGLVGNALSLDGETQWLEVTSSDALEPETFTISLWFKTSATEVGSLISKAYGSAEYESWQIWTSDALSRSDVINNGFVYFLDGNQTFTTDAWVHVAVTFDGTEIIHYQDDDPVTETPVPLGPVNYDQTSVIIGADDDVGSPVDDHLEGVIDELRIANRAFSAARLSAERANQADPAQFHTVGALEPY